jgi:hypothetical protein
MKNVMGMLRTPVMTAMNGPMLGGMIWTSHSDIALTMPVPFRTPVRTAAAMTMLTTATIDGAWAISWAALVLDLGEIHQQGDGRAHHEDERQRHDVGDQHPMTATVRARLNQNSLGRSVLRLGSKAVSAMAVS